jgi:lipoprotein-anchoring transpeptidase ErfK/SrfK
LFEAGFCYSVTLILARTGAASDLGRPRENVRMRRSKLNASTSRLTSWIGAAVLSFVSAQAMAQQPSPFSFFQPTMEDVAPGVDHGNSDRNLPEDFQRQAVFYRSQHPPGTIIVETTERHLYLIENEKPALCVTASGSAVTASPGLAS